MFLDERRREVIFKVAVVGEVARSTCDQFARVGWLDRLTRRFSSGTGDGYQVKSDLSFQSWKISSLLVPVETRAHYEFVLRNADGCLLVDGSARAEIETALQTVGVRSESIPVEVVRGDVDAALRAVLVRVLELARPTLEKQQK